MRVLVTGGAGFIGSHVVDALCDEGSDVTVLDNLTTGRATNVDRRARLVQGSILDADLVDKEVEAADEVFHLAAAVGVRHIVDHPLESLRTNIRGTEHVLDASARHGRRVLMASTSEVYGKSPAVPWREDDDRVLGSTAVPRWSYATAKALDEHLALAHASSGLQVTIVRYFNSYGPRLDERGYGSVVAKFIGQALAGEPITVHGSGAQTRCFTYVADTVTGTLLAARSPDAEGRVFNLGTERETSIRELAELVVEVTASSSRIEAVSYESEYGARFEDAPRRLPDTTRARTILGWAPQVDLEDGLARTLAWWTSRG
ncbi:MAG TPA: NAD-dependent epimerase/dehydratase family protein [Acidimicrobiales bacterium]|nr:NAD-dependent epimerase/dehydratase family protein [Acidimicrobiales bacterium]